MVKTLNFHKRLFHFFKKKPKLPTPPAGLEISDFFKLKKVEAKLKAANQKLMKSNKLLLFKTKALEKKSKTIELISEMGEALPKCSSNEEIYEIFYDYMAKLFPKGKARLWIFTNDKTQLHAVKRKNGFPRSIKPSFSPENCMSLQKGETYVYESSSNTPRCLHIEKGIYGYICTPVSTSDDLFGLISIVFGKSAFSKENAIIVSRLAGDIALALTNVKLQETLHELSIRDYLTDLYNRRYMEEMLTQEIARADRQKSQIGLIMLDIDYFKKYNDAYGHEAGDNILIELGKLLKGYFRQGDIICRFGGEEFLIIVPGMTQEQALQKAEGFRKKMKTLRVKAKDQLFREITISLGVSLFPKHGKNARDLLNAADAALYQAKKEGRNRVCLAHS